MNTTTQEPVLPADVEKRFEEWKINSDFHSQDCEIGQCLCDQQFKQFIAKELAAAVQKEREEVVDIYNLEIHTLISAIEQNDQRFLQKQDLFIDTTGQEGKSVLKLLWFLSDKLPPSKLSRQESVVEDCYCVCHSKYSSCPSCKHCIIGYEPDGGLLITERHKHIKAKPVFEKVKAPTTKEV